MPLCLFAHLYSLLPYCAHHFVLSDSPHPWLFWVMVVFLWKNSATAYVELARDARGWYLSFWSIAGCQALVGLASPLLSRSAFCLSPPLCARAAWWQRGCLAACISCLSWDCCECNPALQRAGLKRLAAPPLFNLLHLTHHDHTVLSCATQLILKDFLQDLTSPQAWGLESKPQIPRLEGFSNLDPWFATKCSLNAAGVTKDLLPCRPLSVLGWMHFLDPISGKAGHLAVHISVCEERRWCFFDFLLSDSNNCWF